MQNTLNTQMLKCKSNKHIVANAVNGLIKLTDQKIQIKNDAGGSELTIELPSTFSIKGLSDVDARTMVYSELIVHYEKMGFVVKIGMDRRVNLVLSWDNGLTDEERESRKKFIEMHKI